MCVCAFMLYALNLDNMCLKTMCKCLGLCGLGTLSIHYYYYYYKTGIASFDDMVIKAH